MQSLACTGADVPNLNSFSLLPLGLAWMTSLHFSLDKLLSQSLRRSTFTSRTATSDATSTKPTKSQQNVSFGSQKAVAGCALCYFTFIFLQEQMEIMEMSLKDAYQASSPLNFQEARFI